MNSQVLDVLKMFFTLLLAAIVITVGGAPQTMLGCPRNCGNVTIPFPFGTSPDCYLDDSFIIICNNTYNPPKPFLVGGIEVFDILVNGHLKVSSWMAYDCYNDSGFRTRDVYSWLRLRNFSISATRNKFTAIGCDTYAFVKGSRDKNYTTGCTALCDGSDYVKSGSCNGVGCCEMSIPEGIRDFQLTINSYKNYTRVQKFNPCGYAIMSEEGYYSFSSADLWALQNKTRETFPVVLDWAVGGNFTCQEAQKNSSTYACRSSNSECWDSLSRRGYNCSWKKVFQGNNYLIDGCQGMNSSILLVDQNFSNC